jgi:hypothetical protein
MSDTRTSVEISPGGPGYTLWRGKLLAELALARLPGLIVHKRQDRPHLDLPYDFLVTTERGFCFFVEARAFSSLHLGLSDIEAIDELRWRIDSDWLRHARESYSPVVLFLFDADTEHGRYVRLDTLPAPETGTERLTITFSAEATINKDNLEKLIEELPTAHQTSA